MYLGILVSQARQDQEIETWRRDRMTLCGQKRPQSLAALWRTMRAWFQRIV